MSASQMPVAESAGYHRHTSAATFNDIVGPCTLLGVLCSSGTSVTVAIYDNTSAAAPPVTGTVALTAGQYLRLPAQLQNGLTVVVAGTSPDVTVFASPD